MSFARKATRRSVIGAAAVSAALALTGCVAGEGSGGAAAADAAVGRHAQHRLRHVQPAEPGHQGPGLARGRAPDEGVTVNWVQSAGSNKANEALRAGAIDVGSTAGSAALLARANGSPIKTIDIYSQPEWAALVVGQGLRHHRRSLTSGQVGGRDQGHRPVLLPAPVARARPGSRRDVTVQNLQHADGGAALENGSVDAWSGLDPIMAGAEQRAPNCSTATSTSTPTASSTPRSPSSRTSRELAQAVVDAYEKARAWAAENPDETVAILAEVAGLDLAVAKTVVTERTNLDVDPSPGRAQRDVLEKVGPIFVETGDVASQQQIDDALASLLEDSLVDEGGRVRHQGFLMTPPRKSVVTGNSVADGRAAAVPATPADAARPDSPVTARAAPRRTDGPPPGPGHRLGASAPRMLLPAALLAAW